MKSDIRSKFRVILLFGIVILLLAVPLMLLLEDFVRDAILIPLAYLWWIAEIVIDAIPQSYFIGGLVALGLYIAVLSLRSDREGTSRETSTRVISSGNLKVWVQRLRWVARGNYSKQRLHYHLGRLCLSVLAHEYRLQSSEVAQRIRDEDLTVPDTIQPYVDAAVRYSRPVPRTRFPLLDQFWGWVKRLVTPEANERLQRDTQREIEQAVVTLRGILGMDVTNTNSERG